MFDSSVEIPVWLLWGAGALALIGLIDRILMPSFRWYMRRRLNRAIERLNARLPMKIPPFKLTRREVMIDRLVHDPAILAAVRAQAEQEGEPYHLIMAEARRHAREIVPSFSAFAYFSFAIRASRWLSKMMYRVEVGYVEGAPLEHVSSQDTVVFVMNHRSNMDYVLVTYLAARHSALSYAVGEWARVWPLSGLIRAMGAYFIRRKDATELYRRILSRYVQMATEAGVAQAVFPEGGLAKEGELRKARLGLLSYILAGFDPKEKRDVLFVPVGLNYDRVLEDRFLVPHTSGARASRFGETMRLARRYLAMRLSRRFKNLGRAGVNFGRPLSLRAFLEEQGGAYDLKACVEALGVSVMQEIGNVVPLLPVPLMALVLTKAQADGDGQLAMTHAEAIEAALALKERYEAHAPDMRYLGSDQAREDLELALERLKERGLLEETDAMLKVTQGAVPLLTYYANALLHQPVFEAPEPQNHGEVSASLSD